MAQGGPVFGSILRAFGSGILGADGEIDRPSFGKRVFSDPALLAKLNALVHPEVKRRWLKWESEVAEAGRPAGVIIPLFYEIEEDPQDWTAVICVSAPRRKQLEWLAARGLRREESEQRIAAQWPVGRKMAMADYVILNNGTRELLRKQTSRVLQRILEM